LQTIFQERKAETIVSDSEAMIKDECRNLSSIDPTDILVSMSGERFGVQKTEALRDQYQALLEVTESIASHRDLSELFHDLAQLLRNVLQFDHLSVRLHDPHGNVMRRHNLERSSLGESDRELPVSGSLAGWVWENQQPVLFENIEHAVGFSRVMQVLRQKNIKSCCSLPLSTAHRRLGAMTLGSVRQHAYETSDLSFLEQVAKQVAVAVDNALNFEQVQSIQQQLAREHHISRLLLDVNNAVISKLDLRELFAAITACLHRVMQFAYISLALYDRDSNQLRIHALDFPQGRGLMHEDILVPLETAPSGMAFLSRKPVLLRSIDPERFPSEVARILIAEGIRSTCSIPMISHDQTLGTLSVGSLREAAFTEEDAGVLSQVTNQITMAVENALAYHEIAQLKDKLSEEKLYLQDEIRTEHNFEEIVGESPALKRILKQVETVALTDSTVMLQGETGTGKELFARAIHNLSARRERTLVKVNCAAIPTGLLESELFGHERGAFTGAISQRIGRFELANRGTLFLDEVGDIPPELQPKLLRVLQEQEFERLGSTRTIRVDVRLVAATNADLAQMVDEKQFRSDLYYRLNVFPIVIPPLRERSEDIPLLVRHFVQKYARSMKRRIDTIPAKAMKALSEYHWPGNVRELENFIERAVILSSGSELQPPLAELAQMKRPSSAISADTSSTLEEAERGHIMRVLKDTNWVIGGPAGAAARLGMKRTTLQYRMKKLDITRDK
jgi:formate hydrogenlyase transcriptional activator